jgi:uncharacterized membrane protein
MNRYLTVGLTALAAAALLEAALVPAIVLGGAAVLAPNTLSKLGRRVRPMLGTIIRPQPKPQAHVSRPPLAKPALNLGSRLGVPQALAKTVTFRVVVTALDFTSNYVVLGDFATAAGLSTFALVAGPVFYFAHETLWNYYSDRSGTSIRLPSVQALRSDATPGGKGIIISRALAKTITFRTIATVVDFTTIYVVIGDLATAAGLSAFGFVVGPFVYIAHEKTWERFAASRIPQAPSSGLAKPLTALPPPAKTPVAA